mgnify:CR=1 FL=1
MAKKAKKVEPQFSVDPYMVVMLREKAEETKKNVELIMRHGRFPQEKVDRVKAQYEKAQAAYDAVVSE